MKQFYLFFTIFIITLATSVRRVNAQNPLWTTGTAINVPRRTVELSLFRPSRLGLTKSLELQAHPLDFFLMPHLFVKKMWVIKKIFKKKVLFSSRHGLYYPTFQMKTVNRLFPERFFSETAEYKPVIALQNELLASTYLRSPTQCNPGNNLLTFRIGLKYAFTQSSENPPIIEQSVLFRETMVFTPRPVWYTGVDLDAVLNSTFNYFVDLEFYSVNWLAEYWSVESKAGLMGYSGNNLSAFIGIKFAYSKLPGIGKFYLIPLADVSYTFKLKKNKKKQKGLFAEGEGFEYESFDLEGEIQYRQPKRDTTKVDTRIP